VEAVEITTHRRKWKRLDALPQTRAGIASTVCGSAAGLLLLRGAGYQGHAARAAAVSLR
jgi:hypothetical protein